MLVERARVATHYPLPPSALLEAIEQLAGGLPPFDRISVGFPGMVRGGLILSAPHFVTTHGPGTKVAPDLEAAWRRFNLAGELQARLGKPAKVVNDADLQGAAVIAGVGLEFVVTLGTGLGTAVFHDGLLAPHLELAQHPFRKGETYNQQLGDDARLRIGNKRWNRRVKRAIDTLYGLLMYDHLWIGGGNAAHLKLDLGADATVVDNVAGILGGIRLWDGHHLL